MLVLILVPVLSATVLVLGIAVLAIDGKSEHIQSLLVNGWLCHPSPFEYEYLLRDPVQSLCRANQQIVTNNGW
jgi:hypothetical protein